MDTFRRIAIFIVLPVISIMVAAGSIYHLYGYAEAREAAQRQLRSSAQLAAELIERRVSRLDESLSHILVQEPLSQFQMFQQAGLADEVENSRLEMEQTLVRFADSDSRIASIELFDTRGQRFVAVENGARDVQPKSVDGESWFSDATTEETHVSFVDDGRVRIAKSRRLQGESEPFAVAMLIYDLQHAVDEAGGFSTRHLDQAEMQLTDSEGDVLFTAGSLQSGSDFLESTTALKRPSGKVSVRQVEDAALSSFRRASLSLYAALAAVTLGLIAIAAGGTHLVIKNLRIAQQQAAASEQTAKEKEARIRAIVDNAAVAIITVTESCHIQSLNPAAKEMFGLGTEEAIGQDITLLIPSMDLSSLVDHSDRQFHETETSQSEEVASRRKDGSSFFGELSVSKVMLENERLFTLIVRDASAKKEAEEHSRQLELERATRQRVEDLLTRVREAVKQLASSGQQILATTSSQADGFEQQADSVSQMMTSADALEQAADHSLRAANKVASTAERSRSVGKDGQDTLLETIATMSEAKVRVEAVAECIAELVSSTQAINEITVTVNDIAEQTNVLALNAAVEASRAGEHGRGFAVVAQEVKLLAGQAKAATNQVRQILGKIFRSLQGAVDSGEQGTSLVSEASDMVTNSGELMQTLLSALSDSANAALLISNASTQQSQTVAEVHAAMRQINEIAQRNTVAIREINASVEDLNKLSRNLTQLAVEFD